MAKVLVVDDDANNRLLLVTVLRYAGHEPIEAASGGEGVQAAFEQAPSLVIVDLSLPDMPGTELIRRLRTDPRTADAAIALYTATQLGAGIDELVETFGVRGVIPKPGDPKQILEALERVMPGRAST
jgi:diguanylate cyclase